MGVVMEMGTKSQIAYKVPDRWLLGCRLRVWKFALHLGPCGGWEEVGFRNEAM